MRELLFKKKQIWNKCGLLFTPKTMCWWMQSHVAAPTADDLGGGIFKIYFSGRDQKNRSQIGYFVVKAIAGELIVQDYSVDPIFTNGELGCFDDNGVTPSCIVSFDSLKYLYYIGWNPGSTVRMSIYGGLAISQDNGVTFNRYSKAPIIERNKVNPYINTSPFVIRDESVWRMYYVAGIDWMHKDLPRYNIQYAESKDGLNWNRWGHVCLDFQEENEVALARPYVLKEGAIYKMWFCHKGNTYKMGYAESLDGIKWHRNDDFVGLAPANQGWDSEMVEYPCVFYYEGYYYMLYNGNNYGFDGVGYAFCQA